MVRQGVGEVGSSEGQAGRVPEMRGEGCVPGVIDVDACMEGSDVQMVRNKNEDLVEMERMEIVHVKK